MIKYTKQFVINFYKENGCELLQLYTNSKDSLQYRCKCGATSSNNFANFMKSPHCWGCAAAKQAHSQKYVEETFRQRGCQLLDAYKNQTTRLKFKCKCGEISTITFASFAHKGCYCENCGGTKKLTTEEINAKIKEAGYELLSGYTNAKIKILIKCNRGHVSEMLWNNFQKGKRCRTCYKEDTWHKPENRLFVLKCRSLLRNCLRNIEIKKFGKTEQLLGYNGQQLREYLSKFPSWETIKNGKWHIDHIFPIKAFCDYGIKDTLIINCLENLQPIAGKENLSKAAKYNKQEFEKWLKFKYIST